MDTMDMSHLPTLLRMTYRVLSSRVLEIVALLMTFGLFSWAMWLGTWMGLAVAGFFGVSIFLPILIRKGERDGAA